MPRPSRTLPRGDLFARVESLARNLWWSWNPAAQRVFAALDPVIWEASNHNPLETLAQLPPERRAALASEAPFAQALGAAETALKRYLGARTWLARAARGRSGRPLVAYFCAEYALHESLPQYAGGLGVLAGDHLKSASDLGIPFVAVGLLYRCGYYRQSFGPDGATRVLYPEHDPARLALSDTGRTVSVPLANRSVRARIWVCRVGRVPLYLLDADVSANRPRDRALTRHLYGGDNETRIQQEILLGVGGVMALDVLGIKPAVFHLNEGHAAFCALERLRRLRAAGASPRKAIERVRQSTVFTTHTPVPAGHDRFRPALMRKYLGASMAALSQIEPHGWLALGRENPADPREDFCMTVLALSLSGRSNGVSRLHGAVSREMWRHLFGDVPAAKVPIGAITNGVHAETWLAPEIRPLYDRHLKPRWVGAGPEDDWWRGARRIPPAELWGVRALLRRKLVHFVRRRLVEQVARRCGPPQELASAYSVLDEHALTIGFARRFATYKRAPLIFTDAVRLARILNHPARPVQLIFAGKAHPRDARGQEFAQQIHRLAQRPEFRGRVVLLEDYDMHVGRMLTSGCDVWLNNPLRPQEASGTSGMKPPLHGGLNCSILDGWWPEAYDGTNGWAIGAADGGAAPTARELTPRQRRARDRRDATAIYELLEKEIVPLFYRRGADGVPAGWVRRMVASMRTVCGRFNTHRMVAEYWEKMYAPARRPRA